MDNRSEAASPKQESSLFLQLRISVPFTTETSQKERTLRTAAKPHFPHAALSLLHTKQEICIFTSLFYPRNSSQEDF